MMSPGGIHSAPGSDRSPLMSSPVRNHDTTGPDPESVAKIVNVEVIGLDDAPKGYEVFDHGAAKKFVIDPNGMIPKAA